MNDEIGTGKNERLSAGYSLFLCLLFCFNGLQAQQTTVQEHKAFGQDTIIVAGAQYRRSSFYQWLWGKHYRAEWATQVKVPFILLDTIAGGLKPYQLGGRMQSTSLRLKNAEEKEYVLRSVDKTFTKALPDIYRGTFIENIINDQVSIAHPYAALTIPTMAQAAQIYHTRPLIGFVPKHNTLDSFNSYGNRLYLLEQRPDENWEEAQNFAYAKDIISTEKLLQYLQKDQNTRIDEAVFLRARLFDIFIGDWGRHEDQWRWALKESGEEKIYAPIPRDRDQAYTKFDGKLLKLFLSAADLGHLESFTYTIKNISDFNYPARFLDRRLLNKATLTQWITTAKELQLLLTDTLIENSVKQMPPELYPLSGKEIVAKLKARRDRLQQFASDYYSILAKEAEIVGTKQNEYFEVKRLSNEETAVNIYKISEDHVTSLNPYYARVFNNKETKELRLYGLSGNDAYNVSGQVNSGITIRIIGGSDRDSIKDESVVAGKKRTIVYDNPENDFLLSSRTKLRLSENKQINEYQYNSFSYQKKGIAPILFYNYIDRLFVGVGYRWEKSKWRRAPFAHKHNISARYSVIQQAPSFVYKGRVNQFIGKWDFNLGAYYDFIGWTNFFGIGNESPMLTEDRDFYRMRTRDAFAGIELQRRIGKYQVVGFSGFFQSLKIVNDTERFVPKTYATEKDFFNASNFGGAGIHYSYRNRNNWLLPSKGIDFFTSISYTQNLQEKSRSVTKASAGLNFYIPLSKKLVLSIQNAGATLTGNPEFYQLNSIGGSSTLRGFRRDRFWGNTSFYNSNELQWITPFQSRLFNGRVGLFGLFDDGRVWHPGQYSTIWHTAYGGGILLVPFEKAMFSVAYARSREMGSIYLRYSVPLR